MRSAVIQFPGSNRENDMIAALSRVCSRPPQLVWHKDLELPKVDLVVLPGGFSFGDYLRSGSIAANSPIIQSVSTHAKHGGLVLGVCNGFQILCEAGLLPGALLRNRGGNFICRFTPIRVERNDNVFTSAFAEGSVMHIPIAHQEGSYQITPATLEAIEAENRVLFRYVDAGGQPSDAGNPNGSINNIAGVMSSNGRVVGMMPHPENATDPDLGATDGLPLFQSILESLT